MCLNTSSFFETLEALIKKQGGEAYVLVALLELGLEFIDDVLPNNRDYFVGRVVALHEEDQ